MEFRRRAAGAGPGCAADKILSTCPAKPHARHRIKQTDLKKLNVCPDFQRTEWSTAIFHVMAIQDDRLRPLFGLNMMLSDTPLSDACA